MTTLVCISHSTVEYRYARYVGRILSHAWGSPVPFSANEVERFRNDPVQFQSEVEQAEEAEQAASGPPEAA